AVPVPLVHVERARGLAVIAVRDNGTPWNAGQARILQALANQAAVAIENAQLLAEEKRQAEEKALLLEAARLGSAATNVAEGLQGDAERWARCVRAGPRGILREADADGLPAG